MPIEIVELLPANENNIRKVIESVCAITGVREVDMMSKSRLRDNVSARNMCFSVLRSGLGMTYMSIGAYFGKHHATIMYAIKANDIDMDSNIAYRTRFEQILSFVGISYAEQITHGDAITLIVENMFRREPIVID